MRHKHTITLYCLFWQHWIFFYYKQHTLTSWPRFTPNLIPLAMKGDWLMLSVPPVNTILLTPSCISYRKWLKWQLRSDETITLDILLFKRALVLEELIILRLDMIETSKLRHLTSSPWWDMLPFMLWLALKFNPLMTIDAYLRHKKILKTLSCFKAFLDILEHSRHNQGRVFGTVWRI